MHIANRLPKRCVAFRVTHLKVTFDAEGDLLAQVVVVVAASGGNYVLLDPRQVPNVDIARLEAEFLDFCQFQPNLALGVLSLLLDVIRGFKTLFDSDSFSVEHD